MAQDYNIQFENLQQLKSVINWFIVQINEFDTLYPDIIETSHQDGMPIEMYRKMMGHNAERWHAQMRNLAAKIENEDLAWIRSLADGYGAVLSAAGNATVSASGSVAQALSAPVSGSSVSSSPASSGPSISSNSAQSNRNTNKENLRCGTQRVKAKAAAAEAIAAAADPGREENQRDMHADYVAAFLANKNLR